MGELLGPIGVLNVGAGTMLAFVLWLIFTGKLIPSRHLDDANARGDQWRSAFQNLQQTQTEQSRQLDKLLGNADTSLDLLRGLHTARETER